VVWKLGQKNQSSLDGLYQKLNRSKNDNRLNPLMWLTYNSSSYLNMKKGKAPVKKDSKPCILCAARVSGLEILVKKRGVLDISRQVVDTSYVHNLDTVCPQLCGWKLAAAIWKRSTGGH